MHRSRQLGAHDGDATLKAMAPVGDGLYLVAFLEDGTQVHRLPAGANVTVGRGAHSDVQVDHVGLSRAHFSLRAGAPPMVRDLGSMNGTRVGGVRLAANVDTAIDAGTVIDAGGTFFVLRDRDPRAALREEGEAPKSVRAVPLHGVVVEDPTMVRVHQLVALIARSSMPVIVLGETGVGKEIIATAVHVHSPRAHKPLVRINCAAVPETLLESELFGFERGAFTGATQAKPGLIESADGSSLLLDEIGEMPLATQAKLLRVLESGEIMRLGALKPRMVDVRFIAATNRPLAALAARREFRADLYYRLNGITVEIPPLRQRVAEIEKLANTFLAVGAKRAKRTAPRLTGDAVAALQRHAWPGNVRELRNVIERALTICTKEVIGIDHILLDPHDATLPEGRGPSAVTMPLPPPALPAAEPPRGRLMRLDRDTERAMILQALADAGGHQGRAADLLGVSRRTLINRLNEYGVGRPRKR
jgi:transcriptional regulator with PAS, ATPase and Fis domain